jgi:hypothetical protein
MTQTQPAAIDPTAAPVNVDAEASVAVDEATTTTTTSFINTTSAACDQRRAVTLVLILSYLPTHPHSRFRY